ncbi:MAG: hypothetical protein HY391_01490 [Deltaproteobacteria bacterium]|nr:hypothetical protein [Deltaproteobacteria bacterium]
MERTTASKKRMLIALSVLGVLSLISSLYLYKTYHLDVEAGRPIAKLCDWSETISCEKVNLSPYAKVFNTPIALLGTFWALGLIVILFFSILRHWSTFDLFLYSVVGLVFTLYYIYIGWAVLRAFCIPCTVIHLTVLSSAVLSLLFLDRRLSDYFKKGLFSYGAVKVLFIVGFAMLASIFWFNRTDQYRDYRSLSSQPVKGNSSAVDLLAQCLADKGMTFYGSFTCQACVANKRIFGSSFRFLTSRGREIECNPRHPLGQAALCKEKKIRYTPTWVLERGGKELKRLEGFQSLEKLALFTSCPF